SGICFFLNSSCARTKNLKSILRCSATKSYLLELQQRVCMMFFKHPMETPAKCLVFRFMHPSWMESLAIVLFAAPVRVLPLHCCHSRQSRSVSLAFTCLSGGRFSALLRSPDSMLAWSSRRLNAEYGCLLFLPA